MLLLIYDAHPTKSHMATVGPVDYEYQIEQWVIDTKDDKGGEDGPPVLWEMHRSEDKDKPGPVARRWRRQPDGEVMEVPLLDA